MSYAGSSSFGTSAGGLNGGSIGEVFDEWQNRINAEGNSFASVLNAKYLEKWNSKALVDVMRIRTALVLGLQEFFVKKGLINIDRVSISPITDPLCHDVEHVPVIAYQNVPYRTTHSMIYSKFLACMNPQVKGIFVDSPNIRLEMPHQDEVKQKKYLIDFSQMDVEVRRATSISGDAYLDRQDEVARILQGELDNALAAFESLAADKAGDQAFRDLATIRAAMIAVDRETLDQIKALEKNEDPKAQFLPVLKAGVEGLEEVTAEDLRDFLLEDLQAIANKVMEVGK